MDENLHPSAAAASNTAAAADAPHCAAVTPQLTRVSIKSSTTWPALIDMTSA